jgi:hypothetical protein
VFDVYVSQRFFLLEPSENTSKNGFGFGTRVRIGDRLSKFGPVANKRGNKHGRKKQREEREDQGFGSPTSPFGAKPMGG